MFDDLFRMLFVMLRDMCQCLITCSGWCLSRQETCVNVWSLVQDDVCHAKRHVSMFDHLFRMMFVTPRDMWQCLMTCSGWCLSRQETCVNVWWLVQDDVCHAKRHATMFDDLFRMMFVTPRDMCQCLITCSGWCLSRQETCVNVRWLVQDDVCHAKRHVTMFDDLFRMMFVTPRDMCQCLITCSGWCLSRQETCVNVWWLVQDDVCHAKRHVSMFDHLFRMMFVTPRDMCQCLMTCTGWRLSC